MVAWCLAALAAAESIDDVVLAAPPGSEEELERVAAEAAPGLPVTVVTGGKSRSESVAIALASGRRRPDRRPRRRPAAAGARAGDRCVERLRHWRCDGVVAAARAVDAVKESDSGGRVLGDARAVEPMGGADAAGLRRRDPARALAGPDLERAYDDAQLVEDAGGDVRIVEAPRHNLKVTSPTDLRIAELLLADRHGDDRGSRPRLLTDYHTHLRPDDPEATAERYFTEAQRGPLPRGGSRARRLGHRVLGARAPLPAGARRLAPSLLGGERGRRPGRVRRLRPEGARCRAPGEARHRDGLRAGPRGADRRPARRAAVGLRDRVGALHRGPCRRPRGLRRLADIGARRGVDANTSRPSATRPRVGCSTCSPIRIW